MRATRLHVYGGNMTEVTDIDGVSVTLYINRQKVGFRFVYAGEPYGRHTVVLNSDPAEHLDIMRDRAKSMISELKSHV